MESTPISCEVIKTYPQLEHVFKVGDIIQIIPVLFDEDVCIHKGYVQHPDTKEWRKFCEPIIKPKGSYKESIIIATNGNRYPDSSITNAIGYVSFDKLFKKLN